MFANKRFIPVLMALLLSVAVRAQAPGASSVVFRFTKEVWLNPTVILAKQNFEQSTNVKLMILPRLNSNDTVGSSKIEKAFDKLLSFLVYRDNVQGSIKFYFNPSNTSKPFTFNTSEELWCKFTPVQIDSVEDILNQNIPSGANLNNFTTLRFDSIVNKASRYCKKILLSKPGQCGPDPGNEFNLTKLNTTPAKLTFVKDETRISGNNGGVDQQQYAELVQYYNTVLDEADNSNYGIPWKALATSGTDNIRLHLKKKTASFDITKVVFKNAAGTETYNATYHSDSTLSLSINSTGAGTMKEVVAYYTSASPAQTYAIGAFNVFFYQPKSFKLKMVNLGGATMPSATQVRDSLNKIYGAAFINWTVETVSGYSLPGNISKSIHVQNTGLLSNYMPDMQDIVTNFKDNCNAYNGNDDDSYYLLFGATNDGSLKGYMPRSRNTGFIFDTQASLYRSIAHELGHGALSLQHIFCSDELGEGNRYLTNNLMDYDNGDGAWKGKLYKHQWDMAHDPAPVGWFEGDDEEGALQANTVYMNPAGLPFKASESATTHLYSAEIESGNKLNGILYGFTTNDSKRYVAKIANGKFYGYYEEGKDSVYNDKTNFTTGQKITVRTGNYIGNCQVEFYERDYTVPSAINKSIYIAGVPVISTFNSTAGKKISAAVSIGDCEIDYDAPLTYGIGKDLYDQNKSNIPQDSLQALHELKRIGNLVNKIGTQLYSSFLEGQEWNDNPSSNLFSFYRASPSSGAWTKASLEATFLHIKKYFEAVQQFKLLTTGQDFTTAQIKTLVNENFVCCNDFKYLFKAPFYQLSANQRCNLLNVFLNDTWVTGRVNIGEDFKNEDIILNTITTSDVKSQHKTILDFLSSNGLIYKIVKNVDGDNYEAMTTTLTQWVIEEYPVPQVNLIGLVKDKKVLHFNDNYFGSQNTENILQNSKIVLIVQKWSGALTYSVVCNPYDYIEVTFENNFTIGSGNSQASFVKDIPYKLPALYVYMLFNADTKQKWMTSGKIVVDVALLAVGVGEIRMAIQAGEWAAAALAVADLGIGFADIVINTAFKNEIQTKYPKFFEAWQKISLCYGIGRISQVGLTAAYKRCYVESQIIKNKTGYSQTTRNTAGQVESKLQNPANFSEYYDATALGDELTFFTNVDNNYPNVTSKIGTMDDETRMVFYEEFRTNPNNKLQDFESNPSQIDEWIQTRRVENFLDETYSAQRSVVDQNVNSIASASNNTKGAWGEMASDAFLTEKGFEPLHRRKTALTQGWGETGIDGIFKKNGQYYIVESKYTGSATLKMTDDGKQLSKGWVEGSGRLEGAVGIEIATEIRDVGYRKLWAKVAPDGSITYEEAMDDFATVFNNFTP